MMVPMSRAKIKCLVELAPISRRAKSMNIMVRELFSDLTMVSVMAWLILSTSLAGGLLNSLILSKTTMVS